MERRKGLVNSSSPKKHYMIYMVAFSFLTILLVGWLSFGRHGLINLYHMQKEKERCLAVLHHINEKNKLLALKIRRLKEDPTYFESIARKQLGLVKDNEVIYRFRKELPDSAKGRKKK